MQQEYLNVYEKYHDLLETLKLIVKETETRVINDNDILFSSVHVNFFSRSYIVNLCTYLESYLIEIATKLFERHCACIN
ncbi:hypothetical protein THUN1657_06180 [Rodentibacter abscessus]